MARWAATLTGNLFLVAGSLVCATVACLVAWIPPRGDWMFHVARFWGRGLLAASFVRVGARFEAELPADRPVVFMANHRSLFDIPALLATLPRQTRFMAKRSLFQIPLFGWSLWAGGFIPVDRKDRSTARATFKQAAERLRRGTSVLIFPEETRALDHRLLPFRPGGFLLAMKGGADIVPVGVRGTLEIQRKGSLWVRPGRVEIAYGRPISLAGYSVGDKRALLAEVRERIAELAGAEL